MLIINLVYTYRSVTSALIPVCSQPLKCPLHLKLHILCGEGVTRHGQMTHGFGCHLHHHRVTGRQKVSQVVCEPTDPVGIASLHSNETHWDERITEH